MMMNLHLNICMAIQFLIPTRHVITCTLIPNLIFYKLKWVICEARLICQRMTPICLGLTMTIFLKHEFSSGRLLPTYSCT